MKFFFHPDANKEFAEAVSYYDECQSGLGLEFAEELYATITRVSAYPTAWTPLSKTTRRCLLSRFPYGLIYQITSDAVRIIAVSNLQRKPEYWKDRT